MYYYMYISLVRSRDWCMLREGKSSHLRSAREREHFPKDTVVYLVYKIINVDPY